LITVELLDHMGTDDSVVNAARVSMDKIAENYSEKDNAKLIRYLAEHKHTSPFNHAFLTFRVDAPVFVARQLVKHKFLPWNEISRRYVKDTPTLYVPQMWREVAPSVKQGSLDTPIETWTNVALSQDYQELMEQCLSLYQNALNLGVCPEQARMMLPQSMMTSWVWSGSLGAFADMCKLRLDPHAQYETRLVAQEVSLYANEKFPISWKALMEN
jgi:thymidylate synthase (FAD)